MIYTVPVSVLDVKQYTDYLIYAGNVYFVGRFITRNGLLVVPHPYLSHTYLSTSEIRAVAEIHNFQK